MNLDHQALIEWVQPAAMNLAGALAIFLIGRLLARWLSRGVHAGMRRAGMDETLSDFLRNVLYGLALAVIIVSALGQVGVDTTSAAALLGGAALAIGLSLKDQLSSLAAGVMLILFRPFRKGDAVEIGGKTGTVREINMVSTILVNLENQVVTIPNANVFGNTITNFTANEWRRADLTIGIAYDADLRKAKSLLEEILAKEPRVMSEPAPSVLVKDLADSSINFAVRACIASPDFWVTRCELLETIKLRFDEEGIEIPFPQMTVHLPVKA